MSVPTGLRKEGELQVFIKAREVCVHTMKVCTNERYFPKRYRWCLTSKVVDNAVDMYAKLIKANSIRVVGKSDWEMRSALQLKAIADLEELLALLDVAQMVFNVSPRKVAFWVRGITEVRTLARAWHNKDKDRFKNI